MENNRDLGLKNGMLGTVEHVEADQLVAGPRMVVQLDGRAGDKVSVPMAEYQAIDHGYATTIHKNQGVTVDRSFVLASSTMDRHLTYVAMTRHQMEIPAALSGLFAVAFAAATILPVQSETVMVGMQLAGYPVVLLVAVASLGNTLGAVVNWLLGRSMERFRHKRWFLVSDSALARATRWYGKWGRWSLILSWLPVGGDALTVVAGVLREPLWSFVLLVAIGKTARYVVLAATTARIVS